jgi:CRISPR-associated endonuclease Csn1
MTNQHAPYVLGIDLGTNSIGWAMIRFDDTRPVELVDMGVRIFEAGTTGDIESGKDESRAIERRAARQRRRQTDRQSRRLRSLALVLQEHGLLPEGELKTGSDRHAFFLQLDSELRNHYAEQGIALNCAAGLREFPYYLRAKALDEKMPLHATGRALYHLAQRRGFLSNRKTDSNDKETGPVKEGISDLAQKIKQANMRTLGEYLFNIDPVHEKRIRGRWTARSMYEEEFNLIWEAQSRWHPQLYNENIRWNIHKAIFYQRPLKSQAGTVGYCDLEPFKKRAPKALVVSQQFRILQKINDLTVHFADGDVRPLNNDERVSLFEYMNERESVTFKQIRKRLSLPPDTEFNLERGGEKKLPGNVTEARLLKIFGKNWHSFNDAFHHEIISLIMGSEKAESVRKLGKNKYGLDDDQAEKFSRLQFENGYMSLSKKAMTKLLPLMKEGVSFKTAEKKLYDNPRNLCLDFLPPLHTHKNDRFSPQPDAGLDIRNPVVTRSLTELRRVVNNIIAKYGKPLRIHVELARDIKRNREQRKLISTENRDRQRSRESIVAQIKEKLGEHYMPSEQDIEKVLLMRECRCICPYTGRTINMDNLLGDHPQFDIEHIIPFSRSLSNSFANKTLCYHEENRNRKRNKTPWEAYGNTDQWDQIVTRVKSFCGPTARIKLERFQLRDLSSLDEMSSQQLNDTRYASKIAARYLGLLYGENAMRHIQTSTGQITAYLRAGWHLNRILSTQGIKNRDDHRHHALDAIVIALTSRSAIQTLSKAAGNAYNAKGRTRTFLNQLEEPWEGFLPEVQEMADNLFISRRINRRVRGRLHEDTNYGYPRTDENGKQWHPIRKVLTETFKDTDIDNIIDPVVQDCVRTHFEANGSNPQKAFADPDNHPRMHDGTVIHKVRCKRTVSTTPIGSGDGTRFVATDTNHHMEIVETQNKNGEIIWEDHVVSLMEAVQRHKAGLPVIKRDHGPGSTFIYSLFKGDTCTITENDETIYCTVIGIAVGEVTLVRMYDARKQVEIRQTKSRIRCNANSLRKKQLRKLLITPLGEVIPAND